MKVNEINAKTLFVRDVYEHELGWGSKHDGFVVSNSEAVFEEVSKKFREKASREYFLTIGDSQSVVILSENGINRVTNHEGDHFFIDKISEIGKLM
ncbi:hypothetical protein [Vibrio phage vB_VpaP_SJSY21]|nr:hypothetical protein [Vibrio phage vB_VpaP_SJSY21]